MNLPRSRPDCDAAQLYEYPSHLMRRACCARCSASAISALATGRGCFRAQLRQCAGVCRGDETAQAHQQRLHAALQALRIACWPYAGAVGLVERCGQEQHSHLIDHWHYLGSVSDMAQAAAQSPSASGSPERLVNTMGAHAFMGALCGGGGGGGCGGVG